MSCATKSRLFLKLTAWSCSWGSGLASWRRWRARSEIEELPTILADVVVPELLCHWATLGIASGNYWKHEVQGESQKGIRKNQRTDATRFCTYESRRGNVACLGSITACLTSVSQYQIAGIDCLNTNKWYHWNGGPGRNSVILIRTLQMKVWSTKMELKETRKRREYWYRNLWIRTWMCMPKACCGAPKYISSGSFS